MPVAGTGSSQLCASDRLRESAFPPTGPSPILAQSPARLSETPPQRLAVKAMTNRSGSTGSQTNENSPAKPLLCRLPTRRLRSRSASGRRQSIGPDCSPIRILTASVKFTEASCSEHHARPTRRTGIRCRRDWRRRGRFSPSHPPGALASLAKPPHSGNARDVLELLSTTQFLALRTFLDTAILLFFDIAMDRVEHIIGL